MRTVALFPFAALAAGCQEPTVSTAETQEAAKEHVRDKLGLDAETALFSTVWVGRSSDDEPVLCGRIAGDPESGPKIAPRRFIAALEPPRWLLFEPATNVSQPSQPDKFVEWATACAGRRTV
jgi:hypothetical protein